MLYNKRSGNAPADAIYIGRPSILGNPFIVGVRMTRDEAVDNFEGYARHRATFDNEFKAAIVACHGKDMVCWCAPLRCHGEVIEKLAKEFVREEG